MLHFQHSKNLPKPEANCSTDLQYTVTDADCNISSICMTYPIVVVLIMGLCSFCMKHFIAISGE